MLCKRRIPKGILWRLDTSLCRGIITTRSKWRVIRCFNIVQPISASVVWCTTALWSYYLLGTLQHLIINKVIWKRCTLYVGCILPIIFNMHGTVSYHLTHFSYDDRKNICLYYHHNQFRGLAPCPVFMTRWWNNKNSLYVSQYLCQHIVR